MRFITFFIFPSSLISLILLPDYPVPLILDRFILMILNKIRNLTHLSLLIVAIGLLPACSKEDLISIDNPTPDSNVSGQSADCIVIFGDTQSYTHRDYKMKYFQASVDWVAAQQTAFGNIACVLQVGDLSESNSDDEWQRASDTFAKLYYNVPVIASTGNHDYLWENGSHIYDRGTSGFNRFFGPDFFTGREYKCFEPGHFENVIVENEINGRRIDIIAMEFGPRKEVVEWARNTVASNPDRQYIVLTHEFLNRDGSVAGVNSKCYASLQLGTSHSSTPSYIWETLVAPNDNVIAVVCGHNGFVATHYDKNESGRDVPVVLFNLQYQENGGDGMIMLWEFPKDSDRVDVKVYDAARRSWPADLQQYSFSFSLPE